MGSPFQISPEGPVWTVIRGLQVPATDPVETTGGIGGVTDIRPVHIVKTDSWNLLTDRATSGHANPDIAFEVILPESVNYDLRVKVNVPLEEDQGLHPTLAADAKVSR